MTTFQATSLVNESTQKVYQFVENLDNADDLIPKIMLRDWKNTEDTCSFEFNLPNDIKFKFELKIIEKVTNSRIVLESFGESFVSCKMFIDFKQVQDDTEVTFKFETPDETFQEKNCPVKTTLQFLVQILSSNLQSRFK